MNFTDNNRRTGRTTAMIEGVVELLKSDPAKRVFVMAGNEHEAIRIKREILKAASIIGVNASSVETLSIHQADERRFQGLHNFKVLWDHFAMDQALLNKSISPYKLYQIEQRNR